MGNKLNNHQHHGKKESNKEEQKRHEDHEERKVVQTEVRETKKSLVGFTDTSINPNKALMAEREKSQFSLVYLSHSR